VTASFSAQKATRPALFSTILVPHDLSDESTSALRVALEMGAESLHLMHALDGPDVAVDQDAAAWISGIANATAAERASAASRLREIARREGARAEIHLVIGPAGRAIPALARKLEVDLIIMAARRHCALVPAEQTIAGQTLWRAHCAVLHVPVECDASTAGAC
jgi:nucleotide-binding universal stress UspA family protein